MNNFKTLLKYNLINSLGLNKLARKKNGVNRSIGLGALVAIVYLAILALCSLYMFMFTEMFALTGEPKTIFLFVFAIASLLSFFTTISKANAYIFRTKDFDFLMSLPIKPSQIITIKLLSLYIYNLLFVFTIIISSDIAYSVRIGFDPVLILSSLPAILLLPLFPMMVSSFISFLLGFIPLKQKTKNILSTILYVVLFAGLGFVYFTSITKSETGAIDIYAKLGHYYFMTDWLYNGLIEPNGIKILLFVGISIVSAIVFVFVVSKFFLLLNGRMGTNKTNANYKLSNEKFNSSGDIKSIFLKDMRSIFNYPSVLVQLASGPILSIVMALSLSLMFKNNLAVNEAGETILTAESMLLIMGMMSVMMLTMVSTTSSTISLEGKSFWILKSAPIKTKNVFIAKCLVNLVITLPMAIIDIIIIEAIIQANILIALLVFVMIISYVLFYTFLGLNLNVSNPKFDYDNPVKAVKQGKPVIFGLLIDFGVTFSVGGAMVASGILLGIYASAIISIAIGVILSIVSGYVLFTSSIRKYNLINA